MARWVRCLWIVWIIGVALGADAQEWTRFRGPNGTGKASAEGVPIKWTQEDFDWRVALPGKGHSSPVLWGEKVFLTSTEESQGRLHLICLGADSGAVAWRETFRFPPYDHHRFNSFAAATPVVDHARVYVTWTTPARNMVVAFNHRGERQWQRDLGSFESMHGSGTSPVIYEGKVIVANDQQGESFLIALDAATGETVWKTPRRSAKVAYSTPCVYRDAEGGAALVFTSMAHGITALDPADGEVVWEVDGGLFDKRTVSSPVLAGDRIIGTCGSGGGGNYVVAVRPAEADGGGEAKEVWRIRRSAPYVPTGIAHEGLVFLWSDGGIVTCVEAEGGEIHWRERVGGNYFSSPVFVDGRIYGISTRGEVVVLKAAKEFEIVARSDLEEPTQATPAVARGKVWIRTVNHLIRLGG